MEEKDRTVIHEFSIQELENRIKKIRVFLPEDYDETDEHYPVLYMHDGQNLVDPAPFSGYSWDVLNIADRMSKDRFAKKIIIVGIDNDPKMRILEYSASLNPGIMRHLKKEIKADKILPEGEIYANFVTNTVKTYIDSHYRTLPDRMNTALAGSSCGANISLFMLCRYPDVYGKIGAFSPALHVVGKDLLDTLKNIELPNETYIYHDMGTKETAFAWMTVLRDTHKLQNVLQNKGFDKVHMVHVIDKKATHTELFWQSRFPRFLHFVFPIFK